jgi:hypothetical protein
MLLYNDLFTKEYKANMTNTQYDGNIALSQSVIIIHGLTFPKSMIRFRPSKYSLQNYIIFS